MADIVERLRLEGADAMRKHLSFGMHALCSEAADEIARLRACVEAERRRCIGEIRRVEKRNTATGIHMESLWNNAVSTMANECIDAIANLSVIAHEEQS